MPQCSSCDLLSPRARLRPYNEVLCMCRKAVRNWEQQFGAQPMQARGNYE